jgi:hypothetical protein
MAKNPKLAQIESDFEEVDRLFYDHSQKPSDRIKEMINLVKEYSYDAYNACVKLYKFYSLSNKYPESEIRERLKSKVRVYALKVKNLSLENKGT